ncbi:MAG: succinylglutamate desuccinylase/aspartoacylase family protein [Pigmentiphaga sp.]|nr:succinylglutamate desuccinylase/aspartoacylase family protein [Pigmentiphaga sp.]
MQRYISLQATPDALARCRDNQAAASVQEYFIEVGNLASGAPVGIPVVMAKGAHEGPCLWINGQVHGDEINGMVAALRFVRELPLNELQGSVIVTPTANPHAFDARRKRTPLDDLDLDQSFPGHDAGLATQRLAAALTTAMAGCADALVSFHTMGPAFDCEPFAVFKQAPAHAGVSESDVLRLLAHFEPGCACLMPLELRAGELPGHLAGALDYWMLEAGKPAFMIELGAGGRLDNRHVAKGVQGLKGMAGALGLFPGASAGAAPASLVRVNRYQHVTCASGGLFERLAEPDTELRSGQAYGRIMDLYGRVTETLSFSTPARLIGIRRDPVVHSGDRVAFVAHEWEKAVV